MNKFLKKLLTGCISAALVLGTLNVSADAPLLLHERKTIENIASGIIHEHIQKFTSEGWWNINVIRVDLEDKYTDIGTLFSNNGISSKDRLTNMIYKSKAVAGINGDFFTSNKYTSPIGIVISDGKIISSPTYLIGKMAGFAIDNSKNPFLSFWDLDIKITPQKGDEIVIKNINKESSLYNFIVMYDKNWSKETFGNTLFSDMVEVIVENGKVIDIRVGKEPTQMPDNGYILVGREEAADILLKNFNIGDKVSLKFDSVPNYENIKAAIGGGTILVKNGRVSEFTHNVPGSHPRSAIGISKDKNELIMVTVDGRNASFKGINQETLAKILIDLGAYEAINLDGGGSTTMAVKYPGENTPKILNHPSDGSERSIINGIGIFNNAPVQPLSYIKLYTDDINMFVNTTRRFYIRGFDKYHNPVKIDQNKASFQIEGINGTFNSNILTANEAGTGIVKVFYEGKTSELEINVLDNLKDIIIEPDIIKINTGSKLELDNIYGKNDEGYTAKIYHDDIKWTITGNIGKIEDNVFYSSSMPCSGAITASLGSASENILVSVGYTSALIEDFEDFSKLKFTSYPNTVTGNIKKDNRDVSGKYSLKLEYDFTQTDNTRAAYINFEQNGITISNPPDKLGIWVYGNNSNHWIRGQLKDSRGITYKIDFAYQIDWERWKWITADMPKGMSYPVTLEKIYLAEINPINKDKGELLFDSLKALYSTPLAQINLPDETVVSDPLQKHCELKENGFRFAVVNGTDNLNTLMKYHINNRIKDIINAEDLGIITGGMNERFIKEINKPVIKISGGYETYTHKNTLFIRLDDSNNSIRAVNPQQWIKLKDTLKAAKEDNIILLLPEPVFGNDGFTDKLEAELFNEVLTEYKNKGKNIFVIHGGRENKVDIKSGIRYIGFNSEEISNNANIFNLKHILFTVNGNKITYEILPVFKKQGL